MPGGIQGRFKRAQELGFNLDEVEALLQLAAGGPESCETVQALTKQKIEELELRIATLSAMRDSLQQLVSTCARPRPERECPLLQSVEQAARGGRTAYER